MIARIASLTPLQKLLLGYLLLLAIGCLLLNLPFAHRGEQSFIDSCFTATSAITTTGLSTVNIADSFGLPGQVIILLLFQVGGLGYMSLAGWLLLENRYGVQSADDDEEEEMVENDYTVPRGSDHRSFLIKLLWFTLVSELVGGIILSITFYQYGESMPVWKGFFVAVSAFCTAGFHLFGNSLHDFTDSVAVNVTVSALSLAGSFGFLFFVDIYDRVRGRTKQLSITTRTIFLVMAVSLVGVTATLMFYDPYFHTGGSWDLGLMAGAFQAISAISTTGFSTVPIDRLSPASTLLLTIFMFIGASPSGTGGGIKNTTAATAVAYVIAVVRRRKSVLLLGARLTQQRVHLAIALLIANLVIALAAGFVLLVRTPDDSLAPIFEAVSALGTVGLSLGTVGETGVVGKLLLMFLMVLGRLGTLSVIMAVFGFSPKSREKEETSDGQEGDIAIEG